MRTGADPKDSHRISVIVPCFNQAHFLSDALNSVFAQTFPAYEILVIDDGSEDHTSEVARKFGSRVSYVRQSNTGLATTRNRGLTEARGDFIQFLDADDVLLPEKFQLQLEVIENSSGLQISYCDYIFGHEDAPYLARRKGKPDVRLDTNDPLMDLAKRWETHLSIPVHCFLFDAQIFRKHQIRFDESLPNHEDWDCWMRVLSLPVRIHFLDRCLVSYRVHGQSMCRDLSLMRDGFLTAIDKQIALQSGDSTICGTLVQRRREIVEYYERMLAKAANRALAAQHARQRNPLRLAASGLLRKARRELREIHGELPKQFIDCDEGSLTDS